MSGLEGETVAHRIDFLTRKYSNSHVLANPEEFILRWIHHNLDDLISGTDCELMFMLIDIRVPMLQRGK